MRHRFSLRSLLLATAAVAVAVRLFVLSVELNYPPNHRRTATLTVEERLADWMLGRTERFPTATHERH
jgi:hypothetical protein